jgi:hypothetical protein
MPDKILTDQPQAKRKTLQHLITAAFTNVAEAPYFSVPLTDDDVATVDPGDDNRELRAGEIFFATGIQIANVTSTTRTVDVEIVGENGTPVTTLAPGLLVPGNDVLTLAPGLSLFKRDLANPSNAGMRLRIKADETGALQLTASLVEREALDHAPDTEAV